MSIERYELLSFDLDDTLWDCAPVIRRAEQQFYDWLTRQHPAIAATYSPDELVAHRMAHFREQTHLHHHMTLLRKDWLRRLAQLHDADLSLIDQGFHVFWQARNNVELYAGVESLLLDLKERYRVCSMTNGNADVHYIGLGHLFDFAVASSEVGVAKPHEDIFHFAASQAGVNITRMLHIGDDWSRDVQGALRAGASAVWVRTPESVSAAEVSDEDLEPTYVVGSVLELEKLLLGVT